MKQTVKKIYHGRISIRDSVVKQAFDSNEDIIVTLEETKERMLIKHEDLNSPISISDKAFESVFDNSGYRLFDYEWNPSNFLTPLEEKRKDMLGDEWFSILRDEFEKDYLIEIGKKVAYIRSKVIVHPDREDTFKAFSLTQPSDVKVVILGQDPYPHKAADGLAFSSKQDLGIPKALQIIYKAIEEDIKFGLYLDQNPNLTYWAEQGVFLLNTVLTVTGGNPKSHADFGWQKFTSTAISRLSRKYNYIVFLLWGADAAKYEHYINENNGHLVIKAEHPTASYYNNRDWEHNNCFSRANEFLTSHNKDFINW